MWHTIEHRMTGLLRTTGILLLAGAAAVSATRGSRLDARTAQGAGPELRFEVASVKPNPKTFNEQFQGGGQAFSGVRILPGGTLQASWVNLRSLIRRAYDLKPYQLEGGPAWLDMDKFDIIAKAAREATAAELNAMLRALLAERFALRVRVEDRPGDVYALTKARDDGRLGPGITPTSAECAGRLDRGEATAIPPPRPPQPNPAPLCGQNWRGGSGTSTRWELGGAKMDFLIVLLGAEFDGPLVDRTELTGRYDIVLEYHSTLTERLQGVSTDTTAPTAPALNDAVRGQLGLRIEKTRGTIPVTIIEAVERPSPD
jgi:uncharacterized protein (TIGR03435 family)